MVMSDGGTCAKWTLVFFNVLFMILGVALLAVGIWVRVDPGVVSRVEISDMAPDNYSALQTAAIVLIVLGVIMTAVCLFGAIGACMENKCYLIVYITLVVILVVLQVTVVVLAFVAISQHGDELRGKLEDFFRNEYDGENDASVAWNTLQMNLFCCGVTNRSDFRNLRSPWYMDRTGDDLYWQWPMTCCVLENDDPQRPLPADASGCEVAQKDTMWFQGCHKAVKDWSRRWAVTIGAVIIVIILLQIGTALLACCMLRGMKRETIQ